jgi:hypothetical protein
VGLVDNANGSKSRDIVLFKQIKGPLRQDERKRGRESSQGRGD